MNERAIRMSKTTLNTTITAIRYKDSDGDFVYMSDGYKIDGDWRVTSCYSIEEAKDVSVFSHDDQLSMYMAFHEYYEVEEIEMVRISTTIVTEDLLDVDDGELKEMRQRIALSKLTDRDIRALGITNIATYIKTKYHNA